MHATPDVVPPSDQFALKYAEQFKWDIFDAQRPTRDVFTEYKDTFHFRTPIYNELNNLLLNQICPKGEVVF